MSSPPSASDNILPGPLVTPAASAQHDCSAGSELPPDKQRRHPVRGQLVHQEVQQVPSPSRAESPTAHQWSKKSNTHPSSAFPLKKIPRTSLETFARPGFSHSPQLSERDSIFATHYLPSDNEGASTPELSPSHDAAEKNGQQINLISDVEHESASPISTVKVLPHRHHGDASHMEVDIHRNHPLRSSSSLLPPANIHPSLLPSVPDLEWAKPEGADGNSTSIWENWQQSLSRRVSGGAAAKNASLEELGSEHHPIPSNQSDASSNRLSMVSVDYEPLTAHSETDPHEEFPRVGPREGQLERSSSRSCRGRVESSIEANLTNAEPASQVRSRKSSHYLGLFKENTTSPDRKRKEDRGKRYDEHPEVDEEHLDTHADLPYPEHRDIRPQLRDHQSPPQASTLRPSRSLPHLVFDDAPVIEPPMDADYNQNAPSDYVTKHHYRALPRSLLEEIRNFHLTPGGARGTSFSKSIPTQFADSSHDFTQQESSYEELSPLPDANREQRRGSVQCDDEDDENEQISSAVYFPHERVTADQFRPFPEDKNDLQSFDPSAAENGHVSIPEAGGMPNEQEPSHVDISLRSRNDSRILHGDLQAPLEEYKEPPLGSISERSYESTCESDLHSTDDGGTSAREDESSLTDDADMTPTATPTQSQRYLRPRRKHDERGPIGAVELKPYRHQVGGHTTVFRFSRRAVCKQLNNRENEFYERIERRHPEMLMFLPRYIGVLNVTFSKNPKRSKTGSENQLGNGTSNDKAASGNHTDQAQVDDAKSAEQQRIFSQKQVTGIIPKVIFDNNRHIIPVDLFSRSSQRPRTADEATLNKNHLSNSDKIPTTTEKRLQSSSLADRQAASPSKKHNISWGATTVNRKLQEQVLREVFSPPAIHQHRRHARGHLNLPRNSSDIGSRRRANLSEDQTSSSRRTAPAPGPRELDEPPRSQAIDIANKPTEGPGLSSSASTALDAPQNPIERIRTEEAQPPRSTSLNRDRQVRRRHSGSGLQRNRTMNGNEGELMFFDDEGYGGDKEDEIFSMEGDPSMAPDHAKAKDPPQPTKGPAMKDKTLSEVPASTDIMIKSPVRPGSKDDNRFQLPSNPKEAQTRKDDRVQFFLLLEDLTAGMNKPCVLDLKMGTRQYGIEADDKKRKSQRRKCQSTTSQQLGVRLCGMQTWNIKKQEYSFEDKYFGRDLQSGREFQDALTRFLYDGVSYTSVAKKIPVILEKLSKLENMIRKLKSYRLYASSLLILYDGEQASPEKPEKVETQSPDKRTPLNRRASDDGRSPIDVHLKIVDFANCVTGEDPLPPTARCPPQHPDDIDRGYLRGLRTLRMYFQRILKETRQDDFIERGEGEAALGSRVSGNEDSSERFWDESVMDSDPGEVSF